MKVSCGYRRPWFDVPVNRIRFVRELEAAGAAPTIVRSTRKGGFAIRCTLIPTGLATRIVTIDFARDDPDNPRVWSDGGPRSPHRYPDDSLCMWHPADPPEKRWLWRHGSRQLLAQICAHLLREQWWAHTDIWYGEEAPHAQ